MDKQPKKLTVWSRRPKRESIISEEEITLLAKDLEKTKSFKDVFLQVLKR